MELARTIIKKIIRDKFLLALLAVFVVAWIGGHFINDDDKPKGDKPAGNNAQAAPGADAAPAPQAQGAGAQVQAQGGQPSQAGQGGEAGQAGQAAQGNRLTPQLAVEFVTWWINLALDYDPRTAQQSHNQALTYMLPNSAEAYKAAYWSPAIINAVSAQQMACAFRPTSIQPQAINPDGSIVVSVQGQLVTQYGGPPVTQQYLGSFLIRREPDGIRVAAMATQAGSIPGGVNY